MKNIKKIVLLLLLILTLCSCSIVNFDYENKLEENNNVLVNDNELIAHFIDVGQGDANFIELPNGNTMLIDAGESYVSNSIINYINTLGYTDIDYIVATHPHTDHIGGLENIINTFDINTIYMPKAISTSKTYENLLETIQSKGLKVHTGKSGVEILNEEDLRIEIVAPNSDKYSSLNNYSIVLKIIYKNVSFLYTGDAEELSEKEINADVKADVLKVGHHGSDTSTSDEFLKMVSPRYAVISVGANNSYDHPSNSTIKKLKKYTNNIYRTDLNGSVIIKTNGINIEVETSE